MASKLETMICYIPNQTLRATAADYTFEASMNQSMGCYTGHYVRIAQIC